MTDGVERGGVTRIDGAIELFNDQLGIALLASIHSNFPPDRLAARRRNYNPIEAHGAPQARGAADRPAVIDHPWPSGLSCQFEGGRS
jgi:hypothetical protein